LLYPALQELGHNWASTGGSADTATLLGALLHALKLTQPWTDATAGLAADGTANGVAHIDGRHAVPNTNTMTIISRSNSSNSSSDGLQHVHSLVQVGQA
jgi:hypothetical protein